MTETPFQARVAPWMLACFNPEIAADKLERSDRFIEEAVELVQASDYPRERAHALVDYVYDRPQGEINQEVGGVMVTLAAHCLAHGVDMHEAGEAELARINQPEVIVKIRAKQAAKPRGSALPVASTPVGVPVPEGGWRPIESAPRDGTLIWTYDTKRSPDSALRVCWWELYGDEAGWMDDADSEPEPTHWCLPTPPVTPQVEGAGR